MPNKPNEPMTPDYMDMNVNNRTFGTRKILKEYRNCYDRLQAAEGVVEAARYMHPQDRIDKLNDALAQYDKQKEE